MPVKKYKATSAGRRFMTTMDFSDLSQVEPERSLIEVRKKHSGRNFNGHITVRHKGGGTRKQYRIIDFKRTKDSIPGKVATIEYDDEVVGKAGRSRHRGKRPSVRGIAMNPVDHPHGGGEARSTSGRPPTTPWGQMTMGKKTRRNKRTSKMIVRKRGAK